MNDDDKEIMYIQKSQMSRVGNVDELTDSVVTVLGGIPFTKNSGAMQRLGRLV
jgi:hypothetical protein